MLLLEPTESPQALLMLAGAAATVLAAAGMPALGSAQARTPACYGVVVTLVEPDSIQRHDMRDLSHRPCSGVSWSWHQLSFCFNPQPQLEVGAGSKRLRTMLPRLSKLG